MSVAFVFGGGGSLAASEVGTLRALVEAGIRPDLVVGTSAGAINAVRFAAQPDLDGVDRLERAWRTVRRRDVAPVTSWGLLGGLAGRAGIVSDAALRSYLERECPVDRLEQTLLPVHVVAADLASSEPVVLSAGDAIRALLASTALPGILPPVVAGGRHLVDGGVAANIPVLQAEALGAVETWVLPAVGPARGEPTAHGAIAVALQALTGVLARASTGDVAAARGQVHLLPAPAAGPGNPLDFSRSAQLIDETYELAGAWLAGRGPSSGSSASSTPAARPELARRHLRAA